MLFRFCCPSVSDVKIYPEEDHEPLKQDQPMVDIPSHHQPIAKHKIPGIRIGIQNSNYTHDNVLDNCPSASATTTKNRSEGIRKVNSSNAGRHSLFENHRPLMAFSKSLNDMRRLFSFSTENIHHPSQSEPEILKIFIGTWNMNGKIPSIDISSYIKRGIKSNCHFLVFGSQECSKSIEKSIVFPSKDLWERKLKGIIGENYSMLHSETLGALHLVVFIWKPLRKYVKSCCSNRISTGIANVIGNKGAVAISIALNDITILFVNNHFNAHQNNVQKRNDDYNRVNRDLRLYETNASADPSPLLADRYDYVFWFGDLNYRVNCSRAMADKLIEEKRIEVLLNNDQLTQEIRKKQVFSGFKEGMISFLPTYKFDVSPEEYNPSPTTPKTPPLKTKKKKIYGYDSTSKERIPSWTDRILFKSRIDTSNVMMDNLYANVLSQGERKEFLSPISPTSPTTDVTPEYSIQTKNYEAITEYNCSDHKPVIGIYTIDHPMEKVRDIVDAHNRNREESKDGCVIM